MLKPAISYKEKLNQAWQNILFQDRYRFFNFSNYWNYEIKLQDSSWDSIQMVSLDQKENIKGYFCATCDRCSNIVSGIAALNFEEGMSKTFSFDFYTFITNLFIKHSFHKIEWMVVLGNPAEAMYDKIIKKYNGNMVGISHESTMLEDGKYYDVKKYEVFKRDFENIQNRKRLRI